MGTDSGSHPFIPIIVVGVVLAFAACIGMCLYGEPGPTEGSACMIDSETLRYDTEMWVSDTPIPTTGIVKAGNHGSAVEKFVSAEYLGDGQWEVLFLNTHTDKEAVQILPTCRD